MATYQVDRFTPAAYYRGQSAVSSLDVRTGTTSVTVDDGGTYTLYDASGVSKATATTSSGQASFTVPSDLEIGSKGYEVWAITVDSGAASMVIKRQVLITVSSMLHSPVTNSALIASHEGWTSYPNSQTSWETQILIAWYRVLRWLIQHTRMAAQAEIHSVDVLFEAALAGARMEAARANATFGQEDALAWFRHYRMEFHDELHNLRDRYDTTGDGVPDTGFAHIGASSARPFPGVTPSSGAW